MTRKRRNHSPEFKAKVALAAAKGDKTVAELAQKYNLHANQSSTWKKSCSTMLLFSLPLKTSQVKTALQTLINFTQRSVN